MEYKINKRPKSEVELAVSFTAQELEAKKEPAAKKISEHIEVKGFRKGMVPMEMVIKEVGEMKVLEHAAEILVQESYSKILTDEKIEPISQPKIEFEKLAPGNDFIYKATIITIPSVEIGDISKIKAKAPKVEIAEAEVEKVISELKELAAMEILEEREAKMGDKVELNFDVLRDGVPIDGGQGRKYPLVLGKGQMIPGFEEAVVGMKRDDEKEIELTFPEKYHNKNLAGKPATFKLKVNGVFKREMPASDDNFAVMQGQKSFADLQRVIRENLELEEKAKQDQRLELEIIEQLIKSSRFSDLPDAMVSQELTRMVEELKEQVAQQGLSFADYLTHLKKTEEQLKVDFAKRAQDRVKAALLTRAIFLQNDMKVDHDAVHEEIKRYKMMYANNPELAKQFDTHEFHERMENIMGNSMVMKFLKEKAKIE